MMNAEMLLRNVQATSFLAHDILLYLDTHPGDYEALAVYRAALQDRDAARRAYEENVRALVPDGTLRRDGFDWADGPFPWQ